MEPASRPTASLPPGSRVLVTGGAGFIGSRLAEELLRRGCAVHVLDDLSTGSLANLAAVAQRADFRLTLGSAEERDQVAAAMAGCAAVFHLAGAVGVRWLADQPATVMQRNLRCTEVVLEAAAAAGVPVLLASSSEVYGDGPVPFREDAAVRLGASTSLRGGYACAKAMGEWLALGHARQRGLRAVVARIFNTVGPRQSAHGGMVLPRFLAQGLRGEPITVFGDGSQTRCFASVHDTASALADLMAAPRAEGVFNVGSDQEVRIDALAELVRAATGGRSPVVRVPLEAVFPRGFVDPARRVPCLQRLRATIGWAPATPLEQIVAELSAAPALARS